MCGNVLANSWFSFSYRRDIDDAFLRLELGWLHHTNMVDSIGWFLTVCILGSIRLAWVLF